VELKIKNCNSINEASIRIFDGVLNIKYGVNGVGKSTIAKAIELSVSDDNRLNELTPFKLIENNPNNISPEIVGVEGISTVSVFNDTYINKFVFKQDELIQNSFEIFIKNEEYKNKITEIENITADIKNAFSNNNELDEIINDLSELSGCFGKSKTGYSAAGSIGKGLGKGNKIENIPDGLESYSEYLRSDQNTKWIKWQVMGNTFIDISNNCPYCTSSTEEKKEDIKRISDEYDAKSIEHLIKVLSVVERLDKYFSDDCRNNIFEITKNKIGLSKEEIAYLKQVKEQIDLLKDKLVALKNMTFFTFEEVEKVIDKIESLKIRLDLLPFLNADETKRIVDILNESLDAVLAQAGKLQGEVNKQKEGIRKTIEMYKTEINDFLKYAGYKYSIDIEGDAQEYKMKLLHHDMSNSVSSGNQHLSYGEKNAFSLVLFMYECLSNNPDFIILDDPISSFDQNKKFAIIEMLFRGKRSLRGKTVLMLTHDLEPIIDMIKNLPHTFDPIPKASFLKAKEGVVIEIPIEKSDVLTFSQVCDENITTHDESIIKLVYLRRFYETINDKGHEYQLISNLLHKRNIPIDTSGEEAINMSEENIALASNKINLKIPDFDYNAILNKLINNSEMTDVYKMCRNDYEKLQIFRIINDTHDNNVVKKYINETFHIENEYICQLNPSKYELIPEFIVQECDAYFE
jgi:energy-coupling factor transporter ATP-binding protein EcfA2